MRITEEELVLLAAFCIALVIPLLVNIMDQPEPVDPYCEMVGIWIETGGEYGWPDYRGNYHTECPAIPLEGGATSAQGGGK